MEVFAMCDQDLDEKDFKEVFEKFKIVLDNSEACEVLKKVLEIEECNNENDLKQILKKLLKILTLSEIDLFLEKVAKNEKLVEFIQDYWLEKL